LGGAPADADRLKRYRDLGAVRAVVTLEAGKTEEVLPVLDRWVSIMRAVNG